jgi:hypothetical protein
VLCCLLIQYDSIHVPPSLLFPCLVSFSFCFDIGQLSFIIIIIITSHMPIYTRYYRNLSSYSSPDGPREVPRSLIRPEARSNIHPWTESDLPAAHASRTGAASQMLATCLLMFSWMTRSRAWSASAIPSREATRSVSGVSQRLSRVPLSVALVVVTVSVLQGRP